MKRYSWLLALIVLSFIALFPLLAPGLPNTHDGRDHVARIANFFQNLSSGIIIPRWGANLNWGYGHPVLMFLYPLPSYIASFFYLLGFSFVDSTKLVFGTTFVLSGIAMYVWLQAFTKKHAAFIGALLYVFAPYRFVDLYVRGAIGEHVAFVFPPLICYFIYQYYKTKLGKHLLFSAVATAGLILSHNAISLMFLPFIAVYALILGLKEQKKIIQIGLVGISIIYGFILAAFFWLPAFFEGQYTLRDIVITTNYHDRLYPLIKFIYSPWGFGGTGNFSLQLGIIHLVMVLISVLYLKKFERKESIHYLVALCLIYFIGAVLLMIPSAEFIWNNFSLIQKFQFPWRFLSVTVFAAAITGAVLINSLSQKVSKQVSILLGIIIVLLTVPFWKVNGYLTKSESFYTGIYNSTTDTGESSPIWSVRFMEERPKAPIEFIGGNGSIQVGKRTSVYHSYVVTIEKDATLRENTVYFPGWKVLVDGQEVPIQFQDPNNRGVMIFDIKSGKHTVEVMFGETVKRQLSNGITLLGLLVLPFLVILVKSSIWKRFQ